MSAAPLPPADDGATFSVEYRAAAECPSQASFEAAILARAPRAQPAADAQRAWARFEVLLPASGAEKARLRVALADGTSQDREITADGCAEAMQSMAIIAAMILEAQPEQPTPEAEPVEPEASPVEPEPEPRAAAALTTTTPPRRLPARSTWLTAVLGVVAESGAAPSPGFGATVGGELGSSTRGVLAPSLRLSLVGAQPETVESAAGDASFRLLLARVHGCAVRLGAESASLRFCALFEAGALRGQGIGARNERSQTMPWLGVGLAAFGQLGLRGPFAVELGGAVRDLLVHDEFVFSPGRQIHQVPVVAWNLSLGAAYRVW
jgi:hypothetical protein